MIAARKTAQRPADVVRAVAAGVSRLVAGGLSPAEREAQLDALAARYAERTDVRHPFAPLGDTPLRSRAELRAHFAAGPGRLGDVTRFEPVGVVHETADPEVVVYEFRYEVSVGDREAAIPAIFVVRVRDGEIVESRDYFDSVGAARATGGLAGLAAALAAQADPTTTVAPRSSSETTRGVSPAAATAAQAAGS